MFQPTTDLTRKKSTKQTNQLHNHKKQCFSQRLIKQERSLREKNNAVTEWNGTKQHRARRTPANRKQHEKKVGSDKYASVHFTAVSSSLAIREKRKISPLHTTVSGKPVTTFLFHFTALIGCRKASCLPVQPG